MWYMAANGASFVHIDEISKMREYLNQLHRDITLNLRFGTLCDDDLHDLMSWSFRMRADDHLRLSDPGWRELIGQGQRWNYLLDEIFDGSPDLSSFEFRHTNSSGGSTRDSARAFVRGALGYNVAANLIQQPSPDWLLDFHRNCLRYQQDVLGQRNEEFENFKMAFYTQEMIQQLELRLGLDQGYFKYEDIQLLYDACRLEFSIYKKSPWCILFTPEAVKIMEYGQDLRYYWANGYGNDINYQISCPLLKDLVDNFQMAMHRNGKIFLGRFTQATTLNSFFARLGFFRDDEDLRASGYSQKGNRKWRTTISTPLAGNIAFVLHRCYGEYIIQTFVNEKHVQLPGCAEPCPYDDFMNLYGGIVDQCDIESLCDPKSSAMNIQYLFHQTTWLVFMAVSYIFLLNVASVI